MPRLVPFISLGKYKNYIDNNNYNRINHDSVSRERFKIWKNAERFKFIDLILKSPWLVKSKYYTEYGSWDGGSTFNEEHGQKLFAAYFYMAEEFNINVFVAYSILDLMWFFQVKL